MSATEMLDFLEDVCLLPWEVMEFGVFERIAGDPRSVRCNHVYVGCKIPFILAADSLESDGIETFGVAVVRDAVRIKRFLDGPYPPHNKPRVADLSQLVGISCESYLAENKTLRAVNVHDEAGNSSSDFAHSVAFEGRFIGVNVLVDDETPMGLKVRW